MAIVLPVSMAEMKEKSSTFFIELYEIKLRTFTLRIAACDEDIEFNGEKYFSVPIQRESVERSMDSIINDCTLRVADCSYEMLSYVIQGYDPRGSSCSSIRIQYPDSLSDPTIHEWIFSGHIDEISFANGVFECKIKARFPSINTPNRSFQLACNSTFGDEECGVSLAPETTTIKSVDGNRIYLNKSYDEGFWRNGTITVEGESRIITESDKDWVTVNVNFLQATVDDKNALLKRGCDKSQKDCARFGNLKNYGGFPAIPRQSQYR